jgi:hypothetical protein
MTWSYLQSTIAILIAAVIIYQSARWYIRILTYPKEQIIDVMRKEVEILSRERDELRRRTEVEMHLRSQMPLLTARMNETIILNSQVSTLMRELDSSRALILPAGADVKQIESAKPERVSCSACGASDFTGRHCNYCGSTYTSDIADDDRSVLQAVHNMALGMGGLRTNPQWMIGTPRKKGGAEWGI